MESATPVVALDSDCESSVHEGRRGAAMHLAAMRADLRIGLEEIMTRMSKHVLDLENEFFDQLPTGRWCQTGRHVSRQHVAPQHGTLATLHQFPTLPADNTQTLATRTWYSITASLKNAARNPTLSAQPTNTSVPRPEKLPHPNSLPHPIGRSLTLRASHNDLSTVVPCQLPASTTSTSPPDGHSDHAITCRASMGTRALTLENCPRNSDQTAADADGTPGGSAEACGQSNDKYRRHGALFADTESMKEKIRANVCQKAYNVTELYHTTGYCQAIAKSQLFENLTLVVIGINSLWIAIDTDMNNAGLLLNADPIFQVAEHSFCLYFTFELCVRFLSFRRKRDGLRDAWFCFDSALLAAMVVETWVFTLVFLLVSAGSNSSLGDASMLKLVRLVKLTRISRMARLLRAIPELTILIKGIAVASRSVFFTLCLLVIIVYFFAIVFRQLVGQVSRNESLEEKYFLSVLDAMASLLLEGVLPDLADLIRDCFDQSAILGGLMMLFILLATLTVMNMLIGVLVEVVSVVSAVEKEQMTVTHVKSELLSMFDADADVHNAIISQHDFVELLVQPEAARVFHTIGVDVIGLVDFAEYIFKDCAQLSFVEFMDLMFQFRGSNTSTVKDIVDLRRLIMSELHEVKETVIRCIAKVEADMAGKVEEVTRSMSSLAVGSTSSRETCRLRSNGGGDSTLGALRESTASSFECSP